MANVTTPYLFSIFTNEYYRDMEIPDDRIDTVVNNTVSLIEQKCNRVFGQATYKMWLDGSGENYLALPQYPITRIFRASTNSVDVLRINAASLQHASVDSNGASVELTQINTTGIVVQTDFKVSTYANVSSLSDAINALTDWTGTVQGSYDDALTQLIKPSYGEDALDNDYAMLQVPYDTVGVRISSESNYHIELKNGCFPCGHSNVFVWWTAGYVLAQDNDQHSALTVTGNVPGGLTLVCNQIVKDILDQEQEDVNMTEEKLGDYSYVRNNILSAIDRRWKDLSSYANKVI